MVRRTRNEGQDRSLGKKEKYVRAKLNPTNPTGGSPRGFGQWESLFDAELKKPAPRIAWRTLTDHHCDPRALKSALFYAADRLKDAQEVPQTWQDFNRARQETLNQVVELKKTLRELMVLRTPRGEAADTALFLSGVKKKDASLFKDFPGLLMRFESVLRVLQFPSERRDTFQDWLIASGELLLHIYVKEITKNLFSAETSVLLEANAVSCGLNLGREYSTEAVSRRFRRFRRGNDSDYKEIKVLVRRFARNGDKFLERFLDTRKVQLSLLVALHQFLLAGADPLRLFRRFSIDKQSVP